MPLPFSYFIYFLPFCQDLNCLLFVPLQPFPRIFLGISERGLEIDIDLRAVQHDIHTDIHPQHNQDNRSKAAIYIQRIGKERVIQGKRIGKYHPGYRREKSPRHLAFEGGFPIGQHFIQY